MQIDWLTSLVPEDTEVVTVILDSTQESEQGTQTVQTRWRDLRRTLEARGAPATTLNHVEEVVRVPTGVGGKHGRVLVASEAGLIIDRVIADPPAADEAMVGLCVPALARVADETVRYLLAEIDRNGADLTYQSNAAFDYSEDEGESSSVDGGHDDIHKVRRTGMANRRLQARVADSWERNAEVVAEELDRVVARRRPELLMLTGDVRAVALVRERLGQEAADVATVIEGGSRAAGVNAEAFSRKVQEALDIFRTQRREDVVGRFRAEEGREGSATRGMADVVSALQRGQVLELLLSESAAGPPSELALRSLWVGQSPFELAMSHTELFDLGVVEPREIRADLAIGRAVATQRSGVTIVEEASASLPDGIGALLRWRDSATPGETLYSQSGDAERV